MKQLHGIRWHTRRFFALLAVLLLWACGASDALAARTYRTWEEAGVKLYSPREQDWTYVTLENFEDSIDLIKSHGFDADEARSRYESGEIIFEAYHAKALKDGCLRLQIIETDYTRKIWNHTDLSSDERKQFLEDLKADRHDLPFDLRAPKYETWAGGGKKNYIAAGFVSTPPIGYESGRLNMQICNGKAYVLSYTAHHPQSRWDLVKDKEEGAVRERLKDMNLIMDKQPAPVKLTLSFPTVSMIAQNSMTIRGSSEEGAVVDVVCEGAQVYGQTEKNGEFSASLFFDEEGEYEVIITASHENKADTIRRFPLIVSDTVCPVMLESAPDTWMESGKALFSGVTLPHASVQITIGEQTHALETDAQGRFRLESDMKKHGDYPVSIAASREGLEDGGIDYTVTVWADQDEKIRQARARNSGLSLKRFINYADDHIGETVSYEARVDEIVYADGGLNLRVSTQDEDGKRQRYMLKTIGYMEDQIYEEMRLTFYGEIQGRKVMTKGNGDEVELPCILVDCAKWVVIEE
ncbi:MAG: hypothetical protein IJ313_06510 [Clostridia bacterium]|nr:hypothetical protein [Clostridia bacterium]